MNSLLKKEDEIMPTLDKRRAVRAEQINIDGIVATRVTGLGDYSLSKTFDCGQCFRFEPSQVVAGAFEGVAFGRFLRVYQDTPDDMTLLYVDIEEYENIWRGFFAIDRDWDAMREDIRSRCAELSDAADIAGDIRILTQERFEALVSFIISQCNNIPRIKKLISALCERYGHPILTPEGKTVYTFPSADDILARPLSDLTSLKLGYRDKYIYAAALAAKNGILDEISAAESTREAERIVCSIEGVGKKVASCVLLFGFARYDAFPVDVWMKRALARLFPDVNDYGVFGSYAGVAQQYMFYCERYVNGK